MTLNSAKWTIDDYHRMLDAGILNNERKVELLRGSIVEMALEGKQHTHFSRTLQLGSCSTAWEFSSSQAVFVLAIFKDCHGFGLKIYV